MHEGRHFVAGLSSGVASAAILQPLDLLKTRVQQFGGHSLTACFKELAASPNLAAAFWRGTVPSTLRTGFGSALYFTTLNALRQHAVRWDIQKDRSRVDAKNRSSALPTISNTANLVTGAVARTFAGLVLMPLTVIKVRYESSLYSYGSLADAGAGIYRSSGARGFFSGFGATAVRDAPYAGLYVLFYEQMKLHLGAIAADSTHPRVVNDWVAASINFSSGILAGAACSFVSNPFDAIKTRIQLEPLVYTNLFQAARKMVAGEGLRSLWDGLALRMTRKALSSALAWTVYEELIRRAEHRFSGD